MFKISLYHDYCVALHKHINPYSHRIDQSNRTYNLPTPAIRERLSGGQKTRFPHALPCRSFEILGLDIRIRRRTDGHDTYISQFMGETVRIGRYQRSGNPSWSWTQAYHGLFGWGSRTYRHRKRPAECKESQGGLVAGNGQRSFGETFRAFLSALARDIGV